MKELMNERTNEETILNSINLIKLYVRGKVSKNF